MNFSEKFTQKNYNVQNLRYICAALVVISHACYLCGGNHRDIMLRLTNGHYDFGKFAVSIFFFLSGLYVSKSLCEKPQHYLRNRLGRVIPQLFLTILFTVFIIGPVVTILPVREYFKSIGTYQYFSNVIFVLNYSLPGVFTHNPYNPPAVNGSLWTLPLEMGLYFILYVFYKIRLLERKKFNIAFILLIVLWLSGYDVAEHFFAGYMDHMELCIIFAVGVACYINKEIIKLSKSTIYYCVVAVVLFMISGQKMLVVLSLPMAILQCCFSISNRKNLLSILGNYSYEIYLLSWPIQQILIQVGITIPAFNVILTLMISTPLAFLLQYLSKKLVDICSLKKIERRY